MVSRLVPAVLRAADVLELYLDEKEEFTAPELADALGLPRTTVHELVASLVARRYLAPSMTTPNSFRLGVRVFQLGSAYSSRLELAQESSAVAHDVASQCGETVHVAVLDGAEALYLVKVDSTHAVRMVSAVGRRVPAHCTAVGKMLLACLPQDKLDIFYSDDQPLVAMTEHSIKSVAALRRELVRIRKAGVAYECRESNTDVGCVAAPVRDASGEVVAAISISAPTSRLSPQISTRFEELVRAGSRELSVRLGAPLPSGIASRNHFA